MKLWKNALKKFFHAINGIYIMIKEERSLVIHFIFLILVVALGLWLNITNTQWAIIILACALIIGLEIINTAVENLVDMISFKYNLKSRKIKDIYIMIKEERSLVIHFIFLILVVALGLWLNITNTQWAIIILACALIIGLEIIICGRFFK